MSDDRWWRWYSNIQKYQAHRQLSLATAVSVPHLKSEAQRNIISVWQDLIGSTIGGFREAVQETTASIGDQVRGIMTWLRVYGASGIDTDGGVAKATERAKREQEEGNTT